MIETNALSKRYGSTLAVDDVNLRISEGSVFGLVGSNGAGKTTLLGLLAGLKRPTAGSIRIDADHRRIAVVSDTPRFDEWLTGREVVALAQNLGSNRDDGVPAGSGDHREIDVAVPLDERLYQLVGPRPTTPSRRSPP